MNKILATTILSLTVAASLASADDYSVFRVCQDQHVLHTSDGADAGHIEYMVVDPAQGRVISTVVTGGVIGEKHVVVPIASMQFGGDRDVTFTGIDRERFVAAPVIETTRFNTTTVIEPTFFAPTFTHFGVDINQTTVNRTDINQKGGDGRANGAPGAARAEVTPGQRDSARAKLPNGGPNTAAEPAAEGAPGAGKPHPGVKTPGAAEEAPAVAGAGKEKGKGAAGEAIRSKNATVTPGSETESPAKESRPPGAAEKTREGGAGAAAGAATRAEHSPAAGAKGEKGEKGEKGAAKEEGADRKPAQ